MLDTKATLWLRKVLFIEHRIGYARSGDDTNLPGG